MAKGNHKHSKSGTKIYLIWSNIKARCLNPNNEFYNQYGGHGIAVCKEWENSFEQFYKDVSVLPDFNEENLGYKGITIDRIDNNGNYDKNNVRWVSMTIQTRNRGVYSDSKTGYKGITRFKNTNDYSFRATICIEKNNIHIGSYKTMEEAILCRDLYIITNKVEGYKLQSLKNL
jgi:hypothetical protein